MTTSPSLSSRIGRPARILLVDDEPSILRLWEAILQSEGHDVTCCRDAFSALTALNNGCDLLITDFHMPHMGGGALIRVVKKRLGIPCILMTGSAGHEAESAGLAAGADRILHKPVPMVEMLHLIGCLVRLRPTA